MHFQASFSHAQNLKICCPQPSVLSVSLYSFNYGYFDHSREGQRSAAMVTKGKMRPPDLLVTLRSEDLHPCEQIVPSRESRITDSRLLECIVSFNRQCN